MNAPERSKELTNALTVDVEDYFQVSAMAPHIARDSWDAQPCRVERNVQRLLTMFAQHRAHATFFTLGWVAERYPQLVRDIVAGGHELASHGYGHERASDQSRSDFAQDVQRAKALLADGKGMVFLHHAIAGWPAWEEYAQIIGGRFHYQPATLAGIDYPDSGYRHDVTHTIEVIDPSHPICAGIAPSFSMTDEVYLYPVLDDVQPLMRSTYEFVDTNFYSADRAIRGSRNDRAGWHHPRGSNLVAWTKTVGASPLAYVQFGDGPGTYVDANYRRILANAIHWAANERES